MKFSKRISTLKNSPIRKLVPYADEAKKRGLKGIHFNIGQPDLPTPHDFFDAVNDYNVEVLGYADSRGLKRTLETTQLYLHNYGLDFDLSEILITNGASEGLIFTMLTLLDKDDEIMTVEPYYTNYNSFVKISGGKLVALETTIEDNFMIPPKEVWQKHLTDKTKAILLSSP